MRAKQGSVFIVVMADRIPKLTRTIYVPKSTASKVAKVSLENRVIHCGATDIIFTDDGKQFTSKFYAALCASLSTKLATAIEDHPLTNRQVGRCNPPLVTKLQHYIDKDQHDWDMFV